MALVNNTNDVIMDYNVTVDSVEWNWR